MSLGLLHFRRLRPFSKLGVIEGQLRVLSGKPSDEDVFRPLEDLQEAVLDYQVCSRPHPWHSFRR